MELALDEWVKCVGAPPGSWDPFRHLCDLLDAELDEARLWAESRSRVAHGLPSVQPMPGALGLIEEFTAAGIPIAIASNSTGGWVRAILEPQGLLGLFGSIVTRDVAERPKPAPDPFLQACRDLGSEPGRCVAFEDSHFGVVSAKAAGLFTVAVPSAITAIQNFEGADVSVRSLAELDLTSIRHLRRLD